MIKQQDGDIRGLPQGPRQGEVVKTLHDLLADVFKDMERLKNELQDRLDNLRPGKEAEDVQAAIDDLEQVVSEIECPTALEKMEVKWSEVTRKRKSRAMRRDDCVAALEAAILAIEELGDDRYDVLVQDIKADIDSYEDIEFPGSH